MKAEKNVSVVILAAGNSGRMVCPKPFLKWNDKWTFVEKIIDTYSHFLCDQIVLVLNEDGYKIFCEKYPDYRNYSNLVLALNKFPEYERFYSIMTGISKLERTDYCFIQNVDNPFVNNSILESLFNSVDKSDYYVPTYDGKGGHPILINNTVINSISNFSHHEIKLNDFLRPFNKKTIRTEDESVLYNINTLEIFKQLLNH